MRRECRSHSLTKDMKFGEIQFTVGEGRLLFSTQASTFHRELFETTQSTFDTVLFPTVCQSFILAVLQCSAALVRRFASPLCRARPLCASVHTSTSPDEDS